MSLCSPHLGFKRTNSGYSDDLYTFPYYNDSIYTFRHFEALTILIQACLSFFGLSPIFHVFDYNICLNSFFSSKATYIYCDELAVQRILVGFQVDFEQIKLSGCFSLHHLNEIKKLGNKTTLNFFRIHTIFSLTQVCIVFSQAIHQNKSATCV